MLLKLELVNLDNLELIQYWLSDPNFLWQARFQREPLNIRQLYEYYDKNFTLTYIVYDHTEPVGYCRLTHYQAIAGLGVALLPDYRGYGIGTELTNRLQVMGNMMGKKGFEAVTLKENQAAQRVLTKCGFLEIGDRHPSPGLDLILFQKRLGGEMPRKNAIPFPDRTCEHYLKPGTVCGLDKDGRILCPICHKPIRNQVYMETNTKEEL